MKTSSKDRIDPRDYFVVNHLYESYIDLLNLLGNGEWNDVDEMKKSLKALKRVLRFYGKDI